MSEDICALGLCHRCEWRARSKEVGHAPRCECSGNDSVYGCYMYLPVVPVATIIDKGDKRAPVGGSLWRAREHADHIPQDGERWVDIRRTKKGKQVIRWWMPEGYIAVKSNKTTVSGKKRVAKLHKNRKNCAL